MADLDSNGLAGNIGMAWHGMGTSQHKVTS